MPGALDSIALSGMHTPPERDIPVHSPMRRASLRASHCSRPKGPRGERGDLAGGYMLVLTTTGVLMIRLAGVLPRWEKARVCRWGISPFSRLSKTADTHPSERQTPWVPVQQRSPSLAPEPLQPVQRRTKFEVLPDGNRPDARPNSSTREDIKQLGQSE